MFAHGGNQCFDCWRKNGPVPDEVNAVHFADATLRGVVTDLSKLVYDAETYEAAMELHKLLSPCAQTLLELTTRALIRAEQLSDERKWARA